MSHGGADGSRASESGYGWLEEEITPGTEIVTASRRLARELAAAYGDQQVGAGKSAWLTPPIHFWQEWLSSLLAAAPDPAALPRRLDAVPAAVLWERCLKNRMPDGLLSVGGVVRQAGQVWQRACEWELSLPSGWSPS